MEKGGNSNLKEELNEKGRIKKEKILKEFEEGGEVDNEI